MVMINPQVNEKWERYRANGIPEVSLGELLKRREIWTSTEEEKLVIVNDARILTKITQQQDLAMTTIYAYGTSEIQVIFPLFHPHYGPVGKRAMDWLDGEFYYRNKLIILADPRPAATPYLKVYDFDFVGDENVEGLAAYFKGLYKSL